MMTKLIGAQRIEKLETGILGFDQIAAGGIPRGRTTLLAGTSGSAKTVFAAQFLAEGIRRYGENAVFVTFEEPPSELNRNLRGFGWNIEEWQEQGRWAYVDASTDADQENIVCGACDFGALIARIEHAIRKVGAKRVVIDSIGAVFSQFADPSFVRRELFRVAAALRRMDITALLTAERIVEYGEIARFGVEEFVADNVIILRNVLEEERRRRTIEILKFRGTDHQKGEFPFTMSAEDGVTVIPLSGVRLNQRSSNVRISTGLPELDLMCGGGYYRDSIILVSGPTGSGKTLIAAEFIAGAVGAGEKCLLLAYEEGRDQLLRNAGGLGVDFQAFEMDGLLRIMSVYPEEKSLEDHLLTMRGAIDAFGPKVIVVDSLSALERVSTPRTFSEFVIGITSFIKSKEMAGLFTSVTPTLMGGVSLAEANISTITDSIILLRYVEMFGGMQRGITVLKMRGSMHEKGIRQFTIDEAGMHIGQPFSGVTGIVTGQLVHMLPVEKISCGGSLNTGHEQIAAPAMR